MGKGLNKRWYIHIPLNTIQHEKEQDIDRHNSLDESAENYTEQKKPISKGYILYDSIYIAFSKQ